MPSNAEIKQIRLLEQSKFRKKEKLFVVEGEKSIVDFLQSDFQVQKVFYTEVFQDDYKTTLLKNATDIELITEKQLKQLSFMQSPNKALALVSLPEIEDKMPSANQATVYLDKIQDPGNLGSIIRSCDWFGISSICLAEGSVDPFNLKVVQGSMGSLSRVKVHLISDEVCNNLLRTEAFTSRLRLMDMQGENLYEADFKGNEIFVFGNEGNGLAKVWKKKNLKTLSIPKIGGAESLNVAMAVGITLSHFCSKR